MSSLGPRSTDKASRNYTRFRSRRKRRSTSKRYAAPLAAVLALTGAGLLYAWISKPPPPIEVAAAAPLERTAALAPLNLPADQAPHGLGMEWWYYNGILSAKTGQRYAFHVAVFVANTLVKHTVMHVALTDLQSGKRYASQRRTGGVPAQGIANGFDFRQQDWQAAAVGPEHVLRAAFEGVSFELEMADAQLPVAHRAAGSRTPGLIDFGASGISYYYSRPRMAAKGRISVAGQPVEVRGDVWFDHQWGDFDVLNLGWNWFALHLADGSDLMLYALFDNDGHTVTTAGTISNASGASPLKPGEVELTPVTRWTSPKTQVSYVVDWRIKLPSGVLDVKPFFADGEFDSRETTANIYWEGPVRVTGASDGEGFMELSGYERLKGKQANRK